MNTTSKRELVKQLIESSPEEFPDVIAALAAYEDAQPAPDPYEGAVVNTVTGEIEYPEPPPAPPVERSVGNVEGRFRDFLAQQRTLQGAQDHPGYHRPDTV